MQHSALVLAAVLIIAIGVVHSWLGEVKLIGPLLATKNRGGILANSLARQVLRFGWHITTLAWWGAGAILFVLAYSPLNELSRMILAIMAATSFMTGMVILIAGRGRHHAWLVFAAIAALCIAPLLPHSTA